MSEISNQPIGSAFEGAVWALLVDVLYSLVPFKHKWMGWAYPIVRRMPWLGRRWTQYADGHRIISKALWKLCLASLLPWTDASDESRKIASVFLAYDTINDIVDIKSRIEQIIQNIGGQK